MWNGRSGTEEMNQAVEKNRKRMNCARAKVNETIGGYLGQSQRDCVLQPRVARNELPWENRWNESQPQRGCVRDTHGAARRLLAATQLGLIDHLASLPRVARSSQPWAL